MDREIKHRYPFLRKYGPGAVVGVVLLAAVITAAVSMRTTTYNSDSMAITFGDVSEGYFDDYIRFQAKVATGTIVMVSAMETGIVENIWFEEGSMVEAGDVILSLSNPLIQEQILTSESQLAERQNMLRDTELAMERDHLQLRQDLLVARTESARLRRNYERQQKLFDENLTSREDYLKAKEDFELAAEKEKLISDRIVRDSEYRKVQMSMMRESLSNMQRTLELVRRRADNLNVRASHSGQLGTMNAVLGQNIGAGEQIGQINILDNYKLTAEIDEHYIDRVSPGLTGSFGRNGARYPVAVSKVYPEVNSGKFRVDIAMPDSLPKNIRVGQTYLLDLQLGDPSMAVIVPRGSFFNTSGGKYAFVVNADGTKAERREIRLGRQNPEYYEVLEGLAPDERIITSSYSEFGNADVIRLKKHN